LPGVVSVHFIFAFLAAIFIMIATHTGFNMQIESRSVKWKYMILIAILITLIQIVLGTLVRENIDYLTKVDTTFRYNGLNETIMNSAILLHKIWSWVFLIFNLFFIWLIRNRIGKSNLYNLQVVILICWVIQFGTGLVNIWYALPPLAQLTHIVMGSAIFGAQAYVAIAFFNNVKYPLK
jgi:cytochrome c oxidase assembly protein subunit 15